MRADLAGWEMSEFTNSPAFPSDDHMHHHEGMTRLEYYAAAALQGLLSGMSQAAKSELIFDLAEGDVKMAKSLAGVSFDLADAMVTEALKRGCAE